MPTSSQNGSQTATISTRHQLGTTITTAGTYALHVDTSNMAGGDALTLEIEIKTRSGSTRRVTDVASFANVQGSAVKRSVPILVNHEVAFFLTQTAGTGRAFEWEIVAV
jgi:hypothetical protein